MGACCGQNMAQPSDIRIHHKLGEGGFKHARSSIDIGSEKSAFSSDRFNMSSKATQTISRNKPRADLLTRVKKIRPQIGEIHEEQRFKRSLCIPTLSKRPDLKLFTGMDKDSSDSGQNLVQKPMQPSPFINFARYHSLVRGLESPKFSEISDVSFKDRHKGEISSWMSSKMPQITEQPNINVGMNTHHTILDKQGQSIDPGSVSKKPIKSCLKSKEVLTNFGFEPQLQKVASAQENSIKANYSRTSPISPKTLENSRPMPSEELSVKKVTFPNQLRFLSQNKISTKFGNQLYNVAAGEPSSQSISKDSKTPSRIEIQRSKSATMDFRTSQEGMCSGNSLLIQLDDLRSSGNIFLANYPGRRSSFTSTGRQFADSVEDLIACSQKRRSITSLALNCPSIAVDCSEIPKKTSKNLNDKGKHAGYFPIVVKHCGSKRKFSTDFERQVKSIKKTHKGNPDPLLPAPMIFINGAFHCHLK
jgi:hypothetical protein